MSPAPYTDQDDIVETLHGHRIADPYRWLEDPDSERTRAWVDQQREWCEEVFADVRGRDWFIDTMEAVLRQPRASTPWHRAGWWLRLVNDGRQDQDVLVGARSLDGLLRRPVVLLDPNAWSSDGTTSLASAQVSPDGRFLAYGVSEAGSDWTRVHVLDLETREPLADEVVAKFCVPVWLPDSSGFLHNHFPDSGRSEGTETRAMAAGHLMLHRIGTDPADDQDLLTFPEDPRRMFRAEVLTGDEGAADLLVLTLGHGTNRSNALWVAAPDRLEDGLQWREVCADEDHARQPISLRGGELFCLVDEDAPLQQVVAINLDSGARRVVVPEREVTLEDAVLAGDVLVTTSLADASPLVERWSLDGTLLGRVDVEGGAVVALHAADGVPEVFLGLSSITQPTMAHRLDAVTGMVEPLPAPSCTWEPPAVTITRHRAPSKDGTPVPYFLVTPEGASEGPRPTLLYGYGGFSAPVLADHRAGWSGWLAAGGTLVIANLRGGGEFGLDWYEQGRGMHKQNVFDDAIGVAEHLVATGVTQPRRLAVYGRSNGGLLAGAVMTQRPDLFGAAIPQVGVLDLLRFHTFTIGAAWMSDYGNPDEATDFENALAWSPLHNVRPGTVYPPTLVVTGDHDDRVVPAHSHKFTATLQAAQPDDPKRPIVTRIERATGHGAGKPVGMQAAEWADMLAFAAHHTGLEVP